MLDLGIAMKGFVTLLGLHRPGRAWVFGLLTAASLFACWAEFPPAKAAGGAVFLFGLICATCVDLDEMIIPDLFTIGLAVVGVVLSLALPSLHILGGYSAFACLRSGAAAILGLALGSALGLWLSLLGELVLGKEVLGFGDVKFLGAIGAFCGWQGAVFSVFGGAVLGAMVLVAAHLYRRIAGAQARPLLRLESPTGETGQVGWGVQFPFGPMLAAAAGLYFIVLHPWVDRYLDQYRVLF
jgi:leader peptidase (prepilin peptidase)/N-methyltransferase